MYLLDANIFIQSNRAHYGLDFVPGFWDWLDREHEAGVLCSIEKIADEINAGTDDLTKWAAGRKPMFLKMDGTEGPSLAALSAWANSGGVGYTPAAVATFLASGDYQLVAYAHSHGHTVVTYETSAPESRKRVKIPDACAALDVPWLDPFTMLRREAARFDLR
ncbi:DUF4411 family protein [Homoserinibacter sp. GY 40078]|uniref:DUF4411 family protein n=1 Tax=Homoserinibacter sp. GY 40078 TaxID=2603275 RepID=UPI0011C82C71|nr:DUF4411 family protein [Homoserinibacter sp. GY 40078]TXK18807.1 DUF4411 family protein [Homoserinibacter sp. GY 40078]